MGGFDGAGLQAADVRRTAAAKPSLIAGLSAELDAGADGGLVSSEKPADDVARLGD